MAGPAARMTDRFTVGGVGYHSLRVRWASSAWPRARRCQRSSSGDGWSGSRRHRIALRSPGGAPLRAGARSGNTRRARGRLASSAQRSGTLYRSPRAGVERTYKGILAQREPTPVWLRNFGDENAFRVRWPSVPLEQQRIHHHNGYALQYLRRRPLVGSVRADSAAPRRLSDSPCGTGRTAWRAASPLSTSLWMPQHPGSSGSPTTHSAVPHPGHAWAGDDSLSGSSPKRSWTKECVDIPCQLSAARS